MALLQGKASLKREPTIEHGLALYVQAQHLSAVGIITFLHGITLSIGLVELSKSKHIVQVGIETFDQQVGLNRTKLMIQIGRKAKTVWTLLLQIVGQDSNQSLATYDTHMQVFIKSLRGTKSASIGKAQVHILGRIETKVGTRREDNMIHQVMLVQSTT